MIIYVQPGKPETATNQQKTSQQVKMSLSLPFNGAKPNAWIAVDGEELLLETLRFTRGACLTATAKQFPKLKVETKQVKVY